MGKSGAGWRTTIQMNRTREPETTTARMLRALGVAALIFSIRGVALAATVSFNPDSRDVMAGDTFTVDIVGSDFTGLSGGAIDLGFDSALLTVESVTVNSSVFDFLPDGGGPAVDNSWPNIAFDTFVNEPATGAFTIATITLISDAEGTASLAVLESSKFFSTTVQFFPTLLDGTVNIRAVPVPDAVWLFGSGMMGLAGISCRKKAV
jgi:hypothetical protein